MSTLLVAPRLLISWSATSLTTSFGSYRIYRRARRGVAQPWNMIAEITVPTGYDAATVEARHTKFYDYTAGWAVSGAQWADGWDYTVTVVNATTGVESQITSWASASPTAASNAWLCSNANPWLNLPVGHYGLDVEDSDNLVYAQRVAGRNLVATRTQYETPSRSATIGAYDLNRRGEDPLRMYRAAQALGGPMAFHTLEGDRIIGTLRPAKASHSLPGDLTLALGLIETENESTGYTVADHNLPPGVALDGSADYITVSSNTNLNPGSSAFSVACMAVFANAGSSKYALSKGNIGTGQGYALRTNGTANQLEFYVTGASTNASTPYTSATWFDGYPHVAIGTTSGTAQVLYQDGTSVATSSTTHGSVTNSIALAVGGNNAGGSGLMAATAHAWVVWLRQLTAAEAQAASYYLLGYPGYRLPYGGVLVHDLRDRRCWDGVRQSSWDLSGYNYSSTFTSTPPTVGIPWRLELIDRF